MTLVVTEPTEEDLSIFGEIQANPANAFSLVRRLLSSGRFEAKDLPKVFREYHGQSGRGAKSAVLEAVARQDVETRIVAPAHTLTFPAMRCLTAVPPALVQGRSGKSLPAPAVELFVSDKPIRFTFNHRIPIAVCNSPNNTMVIPQLSSEFYYVHNLFDWTQELTSNVIEIDNVFFVHDHFGGNNYSHWLMDWVPRLKFLDDASGPRSCLRFVAPMPLNAAQRDTFRILKVSPDQIVRLRRDSINSPITFDSRGVTACSTSGIDLRRPTQQCSPWALDFVRSTFLATDHRERFLRLFIGRRGTRKIQLDAAAQTLLDSHGFQEVFLEGTSIETQADMFNRASMIVAAHGAALSNLMFCQRGTRVLEIFPDNYSTGDFFTVAAALDLDYYCTVGRTVEIANAKHVRDHDIFVEASILEPFFG